MVQKHVCALYRGVHSTGQNTALPKGPISEYYYTEGQKFSIEIFERHKHLVHSIQYQHFNNVLSHRLIPLFLVSYAVSGRMCQLDPLGSSCLLYTSDAADDPRVV